MAIPILALPVHTWHCPSCGEQDQTRESQPHTRMHSCRALGGLTTPMASGLPGRARHVVNEREDYVGSEDVTMVDGRPVMNVTTEYADGHTDVAAYAATAHAGGTA